MRFQITQERPNAPFVFSLLDNRDEVILTSGPFETRDACTDAIRTAITVLPNTIQFDIQNDNAIALRGASGDILARSGSFASRQEAAAAIASIVEAAAGNTTYDVSFTRTTRQQRRQPVPLQPLSAAELAELYNFLRVSQSGQTGFELFQLDENGQYYFHFNDADGRALLYSRGFTSAAKRDRRLESVISNAKSDKRFELLEDGGSFYFILKARNGQEIARSRMFANRGEATAAMAFANKQIPPYKAQYTKKRKARSQSAGNIYNFAQVSASGAAGFETFRNPEEKLHYFHFNDENGNVALYSQGYSTAKSRDNGIHSVIKNSGIESRFEGLEENGRYFFILRAGNRQEIARSRSFSSAAERDRMMALLRRAIMTYAGAYGITLATEERTETTTEQFTLSAPVATGTALAAGLTAGAAAAARRDDDTVPEPEATPAKPEPTPVAKAVPVTPKATESPKAPSRARDRLAAAHTEDHTRAAASTSRETESGGRLWLPWIIGLLALLVLLFFLMRFMPGCGADLPPQGMADVDNQTEAPEAPLTGSGSTGGNAVSSETASPQPPPPLGPTAAALGFAPGSTEAQIADLLSDPERSLPARFTMDKARFAPSSHALNEDALPQVDNLVKLLASYPNIQLEFVGHIDGNESDDAVHLAGNGKRLALSTIRARCLYTRMLGKDVPATQVTFQGLGNTEPVASNATAQDRQNNRRLELIVREVGTR